MVAGGRVLHGEWAPRVLRIDRGFAVRGLANDTPLAHEHPWPEDFDTKRDELDLDVALEWVKHHATAGRNRSARKFLESVELHIKLATDPKRTDQIVRGSATLPHGTGKVVKIAVFTTDEGEGAGGGADVVGGADLINSIKESKGASIDYDNVIATPSIMPQLASIARLLGPKGLMPNPKLGTVTPDVAKTVAQFRKGRVNFRSDKTGVIHAGLGKVNFKTDALRENVGAFFGMVMSLRPPKVKGSGITGYIRTCHLCSSMGKSVRVNVASILKAASKAR